MSQDEQDELMRSRTYQWSCPEAAHAEGRKLSGLEMLRAAMEGSAPRPPIAATLDFEIRELDHGKAVFCGTPQEFHYNPIGTVHGGYFGALLDSAMGCAVHTTLAAGEGYTTLEYKINLVRALTKEVGEVTCQGRIVHRGRRIATAEGRIIDGQGKIYAHGSTTCMIFDSWGERDNKR
jgi:uncharacterized protein (TIGR00369 family)